MTESNSTESNSTESNSPPQNQKGMLAWMVHNRVTANLLMLAFLIGGLYMSTRIKQEVFPEFELDLVSIHVMYPGASPEEIEKGILLALENALRGLDGIKELRAKALENMGQVRVELYTDVDRQKVYQDIKQAVDRITTLPQEAERPQVTLIARRRQVLNLEIYGDVPEGVLRQAAEELRERLLQSPKVSQIDVMGGRDYQIHIEVPQRNLRAYGLTLPLIAARIRAASVELPGGKIETRGGQILLRLKDRRDWAREFARIPIITTPQGSVLPLRDIAKVREGFDDVQRFAFFNGKRSIALAVFRVGEQTPLGVSAAVRKMMRRFEADLPPGIHWGISRDRSDIYTQRLTLLLKNSFLGLSLVLLVLGLFLEVRLAFWVTMGIPTSFLGALLFLPGMDVSINMISMFAFIIALGIVVDDAIVAGENIYENLRQGMDALPAAVQGTREVALPISFSILTNVVAFLPLYTIPGIMGKVWKVIPLVVITVFLISWIESLLILPAHLAHLRKKMQEESPSRFRRWQKKIAQGLDRFVDWGFAPFLRSCLRWRMLTMAVALGLLLCTAGYVRSKRIGVILMPRVESDRAVVTAVLPFGSPTSELFRVRDRLQKAIRRVAAKVGSQRLLTGVFVLIEENVIEVTAYLTLPGVRPLSTRQVTHRWRKEVGHLAGLESLRFEADRGGPGSGAALTLELSHSNISLLQRASAALAARLAEFPNVKDIDDGYTPGKQQISVQLTPAGQSLGLTSIEVGQQVRGAFYGAEALRQQRGRNEVRVLVRLPQAERSSEYFVERLLIRTPAGTFVPLRQVAKIRRGRSYTAIDRFEARRIVTVSADVEPIGKISQVMGDLNQTILPQLLRDYPGLSYRYGGRRAHMRESLQGLWYGFLLALVVIYFLLAVPFRSYTQPFIVMMAIPFGVVGAVWGHIIMGYNLSLMSMMGVVALSGVVVNDSLVLIDYANRQREKGLTAAEAIREAALRRFRPIVLTTLTTFGGLAPMIFESSRQARFMIPMALSLGFGILFATSISLILVPSLYLLLHDLKNKLPSTSP